MNEENGSGIAFVSGGMQLNGELITQKIEGKQIGLFDPVDIIVELDDDILYQPEWSNERRFEEFHKKNLHLYNALVRLAIGIRANGRKHWGIQNLIERLRYDTAMQTTGEVWKINNNFSPLYSRLIMLKNPKVAGLFELRRTKNGWSQKKWAEWAESLPPN